MNPRREQLATIAEKIAAGGATQSGTVHLSWAETAWLLSLVERQRKALDRIKATVCGEMRPNWTDDAATYRTRAHIADIVDAELDETFPRGETE